MTMQSARLGYAPPFGVATFAPEWQAQDRHSTRQMMYARARQGLKRKHRDDERDWENPAHAYVDDANGPVFEKFKRIRVASPPFDNGKQIRNLNSPTTLDEVPEVEMDQEPNEQNQLALIPVRQTRQGVRLLGSCDENTRVYGSRWNVLSTEMPSDGSCRALIVKNSRGQFMDPRVVNSLTPSPKIELIESDDDEPQSTSSEADSEEFSRFEEIDDDEDEPMEIE